MSVQDVITASCFLQFCRVYIWEYWVCYYFAILGLSKQMFWSQDPIKKTTKTCFELPCNLSSSNKSTEALPELLDGNGRSEIIVHCYEQQLTRK